MSLASCNILWFFFPLILLACIPRSFLPVLSFPLCACAINANAKIPGVWAWLVHSSPANQIPLPTCSLNAGCVKGVNDYDHKFLGVARKCRFLVSFLLSLGVGGGSVLQGRPVRGVRVPTVMEGTSLES